MEWVVGSRRLVADDGGRDRPQGDRDDVALQGRLQGRLQDVAIVELIQLVCRAHRDAVIEVRDEGCNSSGCGVLTVKNRRVLAAKTENVLVAAAACYAPLSPVRGRFRVLPGHDKIALVLPVEYIAPDTTFLLLDDVPGLETAAQPFTPDLGDEESAPLSEGLRPALIFPLVLHTEASPGCLLRNTPPPPHPLAPTPPGIPLTLHLGLSPAAIPRPEAAVPVNLTSTGTNDPPSLVLSCVGESMAPLTRTQKARAHPEAHLGVFHPRPSRTEVLYTINKEPEQGRWVRSCLKPESQHTTTTQIGGAGWLRVLCPPQTSLIRPAPGRDSR